MLQTQTVRSELLELLNNIMKSEIFSDFILVGGTALALQLGHRNSVDIDMFGHQEINAELFIKELQKFGNVEVKSTSKNILICEVNGVKVDFVNHIYPFLFDQLLIENVRMASIKDIAAMKLNAIEGRGSRKDFVDLYFLLKEISLVEMIELYRQKYKNHNDFMMLQSLNYFYDAEKTPLPKMFKSFDWDVCKEFINAEHKKLKL